MTTEYFFRNTVRTNAEGDHEEMDAMCVIGSSRMQAADKFVAVAEAKSLHPVTCPMCEDEPLLTGERICHACIAIGTGEPLVDAGAPITLTTVRNWYDDRRNVAALIRWLNADNDMSVALVAALVEKPWAADNRWDAYQATLPEADRWCARGMR